MGNSKIDKSGKLDKKFYESELKKHSVELVKWQNWVKNEKLKVVVLFEGRDAAGKGGAIKKITEPLNPRICRVVALGVPTEREKTQWYFQRYAAHLPAAGEIVFFDRSWYNRAGVEKVMGYCTEEEYWEFLRSCPSFERMLMRSGIIIHKYWFAVSEEEQEKRFANRISDPTKRWKFSPMDLVSREKWVEYSKAKDEMFSYTDTKQAPWYVVESDDKRRAQLNCIRHLLSLFDYKEAEFPLIDMGPRPKKTGYVRPPREEQTYVPDCYQSISDDLAGEEDKD
jgi:polyphosphate kinase